MMRYLILPAVATVLWLGSLPAQAVQLTGQATFLDDPVVKIYDGCGPYGHRSHYGYCKDNLHPELTYQPGGYRGGGYGGYGYRRPPAFDDEGGFYERRCYIQETYDGPVRVCR